MRNSMSVFRTPRFPVWSLADDLETIFERAFQNPLSDAAETSAARPAAPNVDVEETESALLLSVDLPGVRREDLAIDLTENVLTVSGERKRDRGSSTEKFERRFTLPSTVDATRVEAHLENGVLEIALPKAEAAKPRSIEIQSGKSGFFSRLIGDKKNQEDSTGKVENQ